MKQVAIGLSPNLTGSDISIAIKYLLQPWCWKNGNGTRETEIWFEKYFKISSAISFNAGRSALLAILKSLALKDNDEVLIQAFTCVAVPNSIIWAGLKPVFVDIDRSLNIDICDAEKKISPRTRVLIVQHTFGIPADLDKITDFCRRHGLILIEDCAHALGARYKNQLLGTFGKAAFFSFGRDKIISSVFGGMAIAKDKKLAEKINSYQKNLSNPSYFWIWQQLLHPLITYFSLLTYNFFNIGKIILFLSQKFRLLSFPVYPQEKNCQKPEVFPKKFPNALAKLALNQLINLDRFNEKRQKIADEYFSKLSSNNLALPVKNPNAVYLRFNILSQKASQIRFRAKKRGMILGNWYENTIDPKGTNMENAGYMPRLCPRAEKTAGRSLNLPTYPNLTEQNIDAIINFINYETAAN